MAQLTCRNLCIGYDGTEILHNLNFEVTKGSYLCIVGENGSGKTSLMKTILGLHQPISGKIIYGDDLSKNQIGYLPQQTVVQRDFPASVWEIVLSGCQGRRGILPFYTKSDKALAQSNIERMGIAHLEKKCYRELSGGQQQRVLLARALCSTERMLLLDEPVTGLDPNAAADMYSIIKKLNDDGITIIMISHDINASQKYATHILHLGKDVFFGTKNDYIFKKIGFNTDGGEA